MMDCKNGSSMMQDIFGILPTSDGGGSSDDSAIYAQSTNPISYNIQQAMMPSNSNQPSAYHNPNNSNAFSMQETLHSIPLDYSHNGGPCTTSNTSNSLYGSSSNTSQENRPLSKNEHDEKLRQKRLKIKLATRKSRQKQKDEMNALRRRVVELEIQLKHCHDTHQAFHYQKPPIQPQLISFCSEQIRNESWNSCNTNTSTNSENSLVTNQGDDDGNVSDLSKTLSSLKFENSNLRKELVYQKQLVGQIQTIISGAFPLNSRPTHLKLCNESLKLNTDRFPILSPEQIQHCCAQIISSCRGLSKCWSGSGEKVMNSNILGWKIEMWVKSSVVGVNARKFVPCSNPKKFQDLIWDEMWKFDALKRAFPQILEMTVVQKFNEDILVTHRLEKITDQVCTRELYSILFRVRDGQKFFFGLKSIDIDYPAVKNCIRGEEFLGFIVETATITDEDCIEKSGINLQEVCIDEYNDFSVSDNAEQIANQISFSAIRYESEFIKPICDSIEKEKAITKKF